MSELVGRATELATIDELLAGARAGRSAALVVRGEAGIGKSALLATAAGRADDMLVLAQTGVETESQLPYAALHMLVRDVLDRIDALPDVQAGALRTALGLAAGPAPDRFLVGLAVLSLLADLANERPVLCVLDDAHWFDRASAEALLFAARRLDAESVLLLFAARSEHAPAFPAPGVRDLLLSRLDDAFARSVLAVTGRGLPPHVHERLLREADGNPLALRELPAAHRAGRAPVYPLGPPDAERGTVPTYAPVEREFAARIGALPETTRTLLLVAAADGTCDTSVVLAAAERLGGSTDDLESAERARLLMFNDACLGFVHPLVRTAAYGGASLMRKRAAHRALADVLADRPDPDRRNWHRAAAGLGPDEEVAAALEETAERARERGSHEAVAAAYDRAAELSPHPAARARRRVRAAEAAADAGHSEWAGALAHGAVGYVSSPEHRARLTLVRARLAHEAGRPDVTHELLLTAVDSTTAVPPELAEQMLLWAVEAGWSARDRDLIEKVVVRAEQLDLADVETIRAHATLAASQLADDPRTVLPKAAVVLSEIASCRSAGDPRVTASLAGWHLVVGDDEAAHELASSAEREGRVTGTLGTLPRSLAALATACWRLGRWTDAAAHATEGLRISRDTRQDHAVADLAAALAHVAAARGDDAGTATALAELDRVRTRPETGAIVASARSLADVGAGRFDAAAERLTAAPTCPSLRLSLPDLVEAAVRTGRTDVARKATEHFERWAEHTGQVWALAVALRCRALVDGDTDVLAAAVQLHRSEGSHPFAQARTDLLHGEALRRARRRSEARAPLRAAAEAFEELGARPWAERARAELRATGETRSAAPDADLLAELTPQERQVVSLAAAGLSNRDIAAQLFLSPRTVGYHLYKAFPKLGVASRAQLVRLKLPA